MTVPTLAPPAGPDCRHLRPGSEYGDATVGIRAGWHLGLDFQPQVPGGSDWIYAVESGVVEALFTTIQPGSYHQPLYAGHTGNIVAVRADSGDVWTYQHGRDFQIELGERVNAGDRLCRMWRSGRATGSHLHMGRRVNGRFVDPEPFLRQNNIWPVDNPYYTRGYTTPSATTETAPAAKKDWFTMATKDDLRDLLNEHLADIPFRGLNGNDGTTTHRAAQGYQSVHLVALRAQVAGLIEALKGLASAEDVESIKAHIDQRIDELGLNDPEDAGDSEEDQQHEEVN